MSIEATWGELVSWLQENILGDLGLRPPATEADLEALELGTGFALPDDLRRIYLINNGQIRDTTLGVFMGFFLMGSEEVLETWRDWKEVSDWNDDFDDSHSAYPPDVVREGYARPTRLPFAHEFGGNHLGLDLDPGPVGTVGQVITYGRDEFVAYCISKSLSAFLEWLLAQYRDGNYRVIELSDGKRYLAPGIAEFEHFLDAVPKLFGLPPAQGQ